MIAPVAPIPCMGRDQARKRLVDHREKRKRDEEKKRAEKIQKDFWKGRK